MTTAPGGQNSDTVLAVERSSCLRAACTSHRLHLPSGGPSFTTIPGGPHPGRHPSPCSGDNPEGEVIMSYDSRGLLHDEKVRGDSRMVTHSQSVGTRILRCPECLPTIWLDTAPQHATGWTSPPTD